MLISLTPRGCCLHFVNHAPVPFPPIVILYDPCADLKTNKVVRRDAAGEDAWHMLGNLEGKHRPSELRQQSLYTNLPVVVQDTEESIYWILWCGVHSMVHSMTW